MIRTIESGMKGTDNYNTVAELAPGGVRPPPKPITIPKPPKKDKENWLVSLLKPIIDFIRGLLDFLSGLQKMIGTLFGKS